jgi:hypothetical protein
MEGKYEEYDTGIRKKKKKKKKIERERESSINGTL